MRNSLGRRYLVLAVMASAAFGYSLWGSFHYDDYTLPRNNWQWGLLQTRPLTQLTFWINYQLGGAEPWSYHAFNLLLHVGVALLLFRALCAVAPHGCAFLAAGLFAVHPIQSEAVAYIFARGTLLSALFCVLCWLCWQTGKPWRAAVLFGVALLCKEECVTFPLFLCLMGPRPWKPIAAMLALAGTVGLRTVYATKVVLGAGAGFGAAYSPAQYLAAQGIVILRYFRLVLIPWGFTIDPQIRTSPRAEAAAWLALIALMVLLRKQRWFVGGMILLIPSSSIFPASDLAADRRMYLPMMAFCALAARPVHRRVAATAGAALIGLSAMRMEVWRTEQSLWREAVERGPALVRPRIQLARAVQPSEGLQVLEQAGDGPDAVTERGRIYLELGRPADALREFGLALAMRPGDAHAVNNRGAALLALGQKEAARRDFERALQIDPALPDARANLRRIEPTAAK